MDKNIAENKEIFHLCNEIKRLFNIEKLIIFGVKKSEKDDTVTDLDICIIAENIDDKNAWVKKAYVDIDSDIPYDIFLYTHQEWNECLKTTKSFASRIDRKGYVVYEKK